MTKYNFREIVVDSDGELLTSIDGNVRGPRHLVKKAQDASLLRTPTTIQPPYGELIEANLDDGDPLGETAALFAANPGRTILLSAPDEVIQYLNENGSEEVGFTDEEEVDIEDIINDEVTMIVIDEGEAVETFTVKINEE